MPYDPELDKKIFSKVKEFGETRITVAVYSYNQGDKKLQLSRENRLQDEWRFAKLGRLAKDEAEAIFPYVQEAIKQM